MNIIYWGQEMGDEFKTKEQYKTDPLLFYPQLFFDHLQACFGEFHYIWTLRIVYKAKNWEWF